MIVYSIVCDKCKRDLPDPWMTFEWKDGNKSHLCKECFKEFNRWLHE